MLGAGAAAHAYPLRFTSVYGYEGRCNDVVYCQPEIQTKEQSVVVFFGGDVQDFTENMQTHRDNKHYVKWNLENTARILHLSFPESHIVVVRPSKTLTHEDLTASFFRMEYRTFSCFENFVPSGNCGAPEHTPMHNALQHLEMLLNSVSERVSNMTKAELRDAISVSKTAMLEADKEDCFTSGASTDGKNEEVTPNCDEADINSSIEVWRCEELHLDACDVKLVGFSKGCVVLNQFLYEFHYLKTLTPDDSSMMGIVTRIKDMYWLDGGHSGGKNTWITSRPLLETLSRLGIRIHIHVTPYQIQDDRRPWIKKEEKCFHEILSSLEAPIERVVHFPNVFPNLNLHFDILSVFRQSNSSDT